MIVAALTISFSALIMTACSNKDDVPSSSPESPIVESLSILEYESADLTINDNSEVSYSSQDTSIASVDDDGFVYGIKQGNTKVTATFGDNSIIYEVTVLRNSTCPYLIVDRTNLTIEKGQTLSVTANLMYKGNSIDADLQVNCSSNTVSVEKIGNVFNFTGVAVTNDAINVEIYCEYYGRIFSQELSV